jgi:hypothetical protein
LLLAVEPSGAIAETPPRNTIDMTALVQSKSDKFNSVVAAGMDMSRTARPMSLSNLRRKV